MLNHRLLPLAAFAFAAVAATAIAQDATIIVDPALAALSVEEMVETRQELMRQDGGLLRSAGAATGAEAVAIADTLITNFSAFTVLFPEGSIVGDSEALPAIWENKEAFDAILLQGVAHANALKVAAQAGDAAAYEAANRAIGGTCGQCHQQFRAE